MASILVVDDDEGTIGLMTLALRKAGYSVIKARGGAQAIAAAQKYRPDLILLDIMMPDIDGLEVCRNVRAEPALTHIPIIMITALTASEQRKAALDAGADDYIVKPVRMEELKNRVGMLLESGRGAYGLTAGRRAKIISLMGVFGGSGTTTAAVNLACSVLPKYPRALVVEMAPGMGRLAQQLCLPPAKSLVDLARLNAISLNSNTIRAAVSQHACGLCVLPGGFDPSLGSETDVLRPSSVETLIQELSAGFNPIFLDLGHVYSQRTKTAIKHSHELVLVVKAEPPSLKAAVEQIRLVEAEGMPWWQIHVLLIAFSPYPYSLAPQSARLLLDEQGIRCNILASIPPLAEQIYLAEERGVPVVEGWPGGAELKNRLGEAAEQLLNH